MHKKVKKICTGLLTAALLLGSVGENVTPPVKVAAAEATAEDNYAKALEYALYFYDANLCGDRAEERSGLTWRKDCHVGDKEVTYNGKTLDVSGGFHDAGDHVKFGLPQGYAATMLGSSYYEFRSSYVKTGTASHMEKILQHFAEYFRKCTVYEEDQVVAFCYQVGEGNKDHNYWGAPEDQDSMQGERDSDTYFADASNPATDQVSEAVAALTLHYLTTEDEESLKTAKDLFEFEKNISQKSVTTHGPGSFYQSSGWEDDYCLAAALLKIATQDSVYEEEYNRYSGQINYYAWLSWDNVSALAHYYGTGTTEGLQACANNMKSGGTVLDNGYVAILDWGSARYNCNIQALYLLKDKNMSNTEDIQWAEDQMNLILGRAQNGYSFVVGLEENSPRYPHHRAASGYEGGTKGTTTQAHILYGALVGGVKKDGEYNDTADDFTCNEVALDYNAGFVYALSALFAAHENDGNQQVVDPATLQEVKRTEHLDATCTVAYEEGKSPSETDEEEDRTEAPSQENTTIPATPTVTQDPEEAHASENPKEGDAVEGTQAPENPKEGDAVEGTQAPENPKEGDAVEGTQAPENPKEGDTTEDPAGLSTAAPLTSAIPGIEGDSTSNPTANPMGDPTAAPFTTAVPFPTAAPLTTEGPVNSTAPITTEAPITTADPLTFPTPGTGSYASTPSAVPQGTVQNAEVSEETGSENGTLTSGKKRKKIQVRTGKFRNKKIRNPFKRKIKKKKIRVIYPRKKGKIKVVKVTKKKLILRIRVKKKRKFNLDIKWKKKTFYYQVVARKKTKKKR